MLPMGNLAWFNCCGTGILPVRRRAILALLSTAKMAVEHMGETPMPRDPACPPGLLA